MNRSKELKFVFILMLVHAAIALPLAYFINIWVDEASTLYTTNNGFVYAVQNTLANEKQAPLYFLIMSLWREVSSSIFFARLFSIICSLIAIKFFYVVARKFWDEKIALFITFFFTIHPYLFWASLEIRGYSLVILLSVLLLKFFCEGFWQDDEKRAQIFYLITAVISLYTNYYLGFLLVGGFVALLAIKRWKAARKYFLLMAIAGIFFLPMLFVIKSQIGVRTDGFVPQTNLIEGLKILWNNFLMFVLPTEIHTTGEASAVSVFRVWIVRIAGLIAIVLLFVKRKIFDEKIIVFGIFSAVAFMFSLVLYLKMGAGFIAIRHMAIVFVPIILLVFSVLWEIRPSGNVMPFIYQITISVFLTSFYIYGLISLHPNLTKRGDWARVSDFIEQNEQANQPIIIFSNYDAIVLPFYYEGKNKILPNEKYFAWNYEAEPGSSDSYNKQIEYIISLIPDNASEIWLLTQEDCQTSDACLPLKKFVESNYNVVIEKEFFAERVRLLRKK